MQRAIGNSIASIERSIEATTEDRWSEGPSAQWSRPHAVPMLREQGRGLARSAAACSERSTFRGLTAGDDSHSMTHDELRHGREGGQ